jgi:citrate (Re)-synthase
VLANSTTAWLYGCAAANCALLGFGERTGNPPLEGAIMDYIALKGETNGIDTRVITEIAEYFARELDFVIPPNYPFVGSNFNVTSAGIHADGMLKNEEIYNIFDTDKILMRPARVNVTDKSGLAGIAHWVNGYLGLKPEAAIDKRHHGLIAINEWVKTQYVEGRVTSIADSEMLLQAQMHLPEFFKSDFDKLRDHALEISELIIKDLSENAALKSMDHLKIEPVLEELVHKRTFIQFIYVTDKNGIRITENVTQPEYKEEFGSLHPHENLADRDWFNGAIETGDVFITKFYKSRITDILCITVSAPIYSDKNEFLGVIGADLKFEELARIYHTLD